MATWGVESSVDITVEIAFASDPWATSPSWTDVSAYVRSIETFRGTTSEDLVIGPGSMRVTLASADRRFDPDYSAGPYFGDLVPMKRMRVTSTRSAVTFVLFIGWIGGWQQDWQVGDGVAYADASDGAGQLQSESLAASAYGAEVLADSPSHYWPLQFDYRDIVGSADLVPFVNELAVVEGTFMELEGLPPIGEPSALVSGDPVSHLDYAGTLASPKAMEAWIYTIPGETVEFTFVDDVNGWATIRYDYVKNISFTKNLWYVSYHNASDNVGVTSAEVDVATDVIGMHHVAIHATATVLTFLVDGQVALSHTFVAADTPDAGETISLDLSDTTAASAVSHVAVYGTAPSIARLQAHYLAGLHAYGHPISETGGERMERVLDEVAYPDNLRDISTGGSIQGPYLPAARSPLDYIYEILASERGLVFWSVDGKFTFRSRQWQWISADSTAVTFSDDGGVGAVGYTNGSPNSGTVDTVRNIVTTSYSDVGAITRRDATSITAYGPSSEFVDAPTLRNGTDASNLSAYVLRLKKDPQRTIPLLTVFMRSAIATNFAPVLGIELGDVVTVERTPMDVGSQIVDRLQVLSISHSITPSNWVTEFYMSPAIPMADEAPYWTIGDATYGRIGTAAGNMIPF